MCYLVLKVPGGNSGPESVLYVYCREPSRIAPYESACREPSRQELSSCGENSTNESKVTLFGTVMYLSFEESDHWG